MKALCASAACLLVLAGPALAADYLDPLPRYERFDNDFKCHFSTADAAQMKAINRPAGQSCMRIGPLHIGMTREELEKILGAPDQDGRVDGKTYFFYSVLLNDARKVIVYSSISYAADNSANSLQLTAVAEPPSHTEWEKPWWFSGVALGDPQDMLHDRMGAPFKITNSDQADTLVWDYKYFSFEIHDGHVTSIRTATDSKSNS